MCSQLITHNYSVILYYTLKVEFLTKFNKQITRFRHNEEITI